MIPNKVSPVLVRQQDGLFFLLVFRHPVAGCQLVKGSIEPGEEPPAAAVRELKEEAGGGGGL